jgi:viroplasmin and RNaseH domain-containing protein
MAWYVVFRGRNLGVYESRGTCNKQISGFSGASYLSYPTRGEAEATYAAFLEHEKPKLKPQVVHAWSAKQVTEI